MNTLSTLRGAAVLCLVSAALGCAEVPLEGDDVELEEANLPLARSINPPGGLSPAQVPQFVSISFDDNFQAGGMDWATDLFANLTNPAGSGNPATFDGRPVRTTFFHNCVYIDHMRASWQRAVTAGHEVGDHTQGHREGLNFSQSDWIGEIDGCRTTLQNAFGLSAQQVSGFRAPFLMYNDALYSVLESRAVPFAYDTSIPSCLGASEDGTNCAFPYTLDVPSVDAAHRNAIDSRYPLLGSHVGFWELPNPVVIVPANLRSGIPASAFVSGAASGKILGMDINMFYDARLDRQTALATLKNTLDLHLQGNRAPLVFVAHTHVYDASWDVHGTPANLADRRAVLSDFIAYALSKPQVRMVPMKDILAWMKNPVALGGSCTPSCAGKTCGSDGCGGSCGTCSGGQTCSAQNQCVSTCTPSCAGKTCGSDGCGGSCGTCSGGQTCSAQNQCTGTGTGDCASPFFSANTGYAAGNVVRSTCTASTVGTVCYQKVGSTFAFRCDVPSWCSLQPGSNQAGWWSAWTMKSACP